LAPDVSHFVHGSEYTPIEYEDIENFRESLLVTTDNLDPAVQSSNRRKPDFSMTNFGLHIQLPMIQLPALHYRSELSNVGPPLYQDIRFAFLACERRGYESKKRLVAIPLHKISHLSYTRTTFNGHTLHTIDNDYQYDQCLPISSFDPVWIGRARYKITKHSNLRWSPSVKRIEFDLSCTTRAPIASVTHPVCKALGQRPSRVDNDLYKLHIQGNMSTDKLRHQVIAIYDTDIRLVTDLCYTVICFGLADRHLWMCILTAIKYEQFFSIAEYVRFPAGQFWGQSNSAFGVFAHPEGVFLTENAGDKPPREVRYNLYARSDEEVLLRMYLNDSSHL
jgi:hypothetical protein